MKFDTLLRSFVTIVAGGLFGVSGGYTLEILRLNYPVLIVLVLFGLLSVFAIDLAADRISLLVRGARTRSAGEHTADVGLHGDLHQYSKRGALFVLAFLAGVLLTAVFSFQSLGGVLGSI